MVSVLLRMRERHVFRGAGYYIVASWVLLQVSDVVVEPAGLPAWSMTALLYLLVLGFPLAIFLAWRYDITEHGIVRTVARAGKGGDPAALRLRAADYLILLMLLGILGFIGYRSLILARETAQSQPVAALGQAPVAAVAAPLDSVAVLPFADLSPDGERGFLGDGISDTVTHVLSQVDGIEVTARTSSFAFRDRNLTVQEIAAALNVAHILEGSVQRAGEQLRIIARLIEARSGAELWSGHYDRGVDALFAIQDEIAQEVATALRVTVLDRGDVTVERNYQPPLAAFEAVIRGREALERGDPVSIDRALDLFQQAVDTDPQYALAYVMLATAVIMDHEQTSGESYEAVYERAQVFTRKALDIDPLLPEAYVSRGGYLYVIKDFAGAERAARRALELRPSYAEAYRALQRVYWVQGDYDRSLDMARRATELDPEDSSFQLSLANSLWSVGRSEEAVAIIRKLIRRDPRSPRAMGVLSRYLRQLGHSGEATYWENRAGALASGMPGVEFTRCMGLLQFWDRDGALSCFEDYLERYPREPEGRQYLAMLTGDVQGGIANAREQVEANPNSWYRKMQLLDWLVVSGAREEAIAIAQETFPALFQQPPVVGDETIWVARVIAQAYVESGQRERADALIAAGLEHLAMRRKLQGTGLMSGIDDVFLLAWAGEIGEAVDRLREAIDRDWQFFSFILLFPYNLPEALLEDPGFQEQVERQAQIMAEERAWYEANKDRDLLNAG